MKSMKLSKCLSTRTASLIFELERGILIKGIIILFLIINILGCTNCRQDRINFFKPLECFGRIDSLYTDVSRKNCSFVVVNGKEILIINNIFDKFSVGDTLIKHKGSMKFYWIKKCDTIIFYPMCGNQNGDEVTDNN
jgi:hypothetical protein